MRSTHRSSIALAGAMLLVGLASCDADAPTSPAATASAAREHSNSFITLAFPGSVQSQAWGIDPSGGWSSARTGPKTMPSMVSCSTKERSRQSTTPASPSHSVTGINGRGEIVGWYEDADGIQHGYVLEHGVFTTVDVPDATSARILGINASGDIVGAYEASGRWLSRLRPAAREVHRSRGPGRIAHRRERHFVVGRCRGLLQVLGERRRTASCSAVASTP